MVLWVVLPLISLASVVVTFKWNNWKNEPSMTQSIAYYGLHRILFISGIAWVINECVSKRAGNSMLIIRAILSRLRITNLYCFKNSKFIKITNKYHISYKISINTLIPNPYQYH